jgi:hypothetical protein
VAGGTIAPPTTLADLLCAAAARRRHTRRSGLDASARAWGADLASRRRPCAGSPATSTSRCGGVARRRSKRSPSPRGPTRAPQHARIGRVGRHATFAQQHGGTSGWARRSRLINSSSAAAPARGAVLEGGLSWRGVPRERTVRRFGTPCGDGVTWRHAWSGGAPPVVRCAPSARPVPAPRRAPRAATRSTPARTPHVRSSASTSDSSVRASMDPCSSV